MTITYLNRESYLKAIKKKIKKVNIVLDIGCGIRPQDLIIPSVHICCEPFLDYIKSLKSQNNNVKKPFYIFLNATWDQCIKILPEKSVDSIFLLDVIEHLNKDEGKELLKYSEKIAREQLIIFTPLGYIPQHHINGKDAWGFEGTSWQEHKSGWLPDDFDESWELFIIKDFHTIDNLGNPLDKPIGAIWAIKTIQSVQKNKVGNTWKKFFHGL
jgi:hypothetical protein